MKKRMWALSLIFVFSLFIPPVLEAKVEADARPIREADARRIRELEKRISALEALEEEKRGFRPARAEWLEVEGDIRLDLIAPEEAESYVELDRVAIDLRATITENVYSRATIKFPHEARRPALPAIPRRLGVTETPAVAAAAPSMTFEVDTAYTRFTLGDYWLMAGLTDRFIIPGDIDLGHRKTAGYPLSGNAFWRDEQYNLTLGGMFPDIAGGDFRYRLSYGSGLMLDRRRPQDHRLFYTIPPTGGHRVPDVMLHDEDHGQRGDEIGLGLGYRYHFGLEDSLDLVGFGIWSRAVEPVAPVAGIAAVTAPPAAPAAPPTLDVRGLIGWPAENKQHRFGSRIVYRQGADSLLMAEYIVAKDGNLDRDAWYLQASHRFEFAPLIGGRFLTAVEPLVRYGRYDVDTTKVFTNPLTWDREQLTLALLADVAANVSLRIEHDTNDEKTGGGEIGNDEFRVQLRTRL